MVPKDWTPIKIPGKNKRSNTKRALDTRNASTRHRGRPLKASVPVSDSQSEIAAPEPKRRKLRSLKNLKSAYKLSYLEKLPVELLEQIFFYCRNCNLPRCSPVFAGKLSNERIYMKLLTEAFRLSWEVSLVYRGRKPIDSERAEQDPVFEGLFGKEYVEQSSTGDWKFQSDVLSCRWATLPRILKAKEAWYGRLPQSPWKDMPSVIENGGVAGTEHFEERFETFKGLVAAHVFIESPFEDATYIHTSLADGVEIPESLLLGPWDDEMVKHLYWFYEGHGKVDSVHSTHGEVALLGLKKAISVGNLHVIALLTQMGLEHHINGEFIASAVRYAGGDVTAVIRYLIEAGTSNVESSIEPIIHKTLWSYRDELVAERDLERLAYVEALLNLRLSSRRSIR